MYKKKSQALLESRYDHPIALKHGDTLSDEELNYLSESVSSIVYSIEKKDKNFYKKVLFKKGQYCFTKKYYFEPSGYGVLYGRRST